METETLDKQLRDRGRKKLDAMLEEAFGPAIDVVPSGYNHYLKLYGPEGEKKDATGGPYYEGQKPVDLVFRMIKEVLFEALKDEWEQREVDEFLESVADLRATTEDLLANLEV